MSDRLGYFGMFKDLSISTNLELAIFKNLLFSEKICSFFAKYKECLNKYFEQFGDFSWTDLAIKNYERNCHKFEDLKFIDGLATINNVKFSGVVYHYISSSDVSKLTYSQGRLVKSARQGHHNCTNVYHYSNNMVDAIYTYNKDGELVTTLKRTEHGFVKLDSNDKVILDFKKLDDNTFNIKSCNKSVKTIEFKDGSITRSVTKYFKSNQPEKIEIYSNGKIVQSISGGNIKFYSNSKLVSHIKKTIWSKEKNITDTTIKNFNERTGKLVSATRNFTGKDLSGITVHKRETALYDNSELPFSYESELIDGQYIKTFISTKGHIITQRIKNGKVLLNEEGDFFRADCLKVS